MNGNNEDSEATGMTPTEMNDALDLNTSLKMKGKKFLITPRATVIASFLTDKQTHL